jgi:hypothetical protein
MGVAAFAKGQWTDLRAPRMQHEGRPRPRASSLKP